MDDNGKVQGLLGVIFEQLKASAIADREARRFFIHYDIIKILLLAVIAWRVW